MKNEYEIYGYHITSDPDFMDNHHNISTELKDQIYLGSYKDETIEMSDSYYKKGMDTYLEDNITEPIVNDKFGKCGLTHPSLQIRRLKKTLGKLYNQRGNKILKSLKLHHIV